MGIPKVKTCCCGCSLETGGLIIGWWNLIWNGIYLLIFMSALIGIVVFGSNEFKEKFIGDKQVQIIDLDLNAVGPAIIFIVLVVLIIVVIVLAVAAILCIRGVQSRNHYFLIPLMILYVLNSLSYFSSVWTQSATFMTFFLIRLVIELYLLYILYCLYDRIKQQRQQGGNVHAGVVFTPVMQTKP